MSSESSISQIRLKKANRFMGPVAVVFSLLCMVVYAHIAVRGDFSQMFEPMKSFLAGDWGSMYPQGTNATSMPGWLIFILPAYMLGQVFLEPAAAFQFASLTALPLLLFSVKYCVSVLWPRCPSAKVWLLAMLSLVLPATKAAWTEYYHPQDIAAIALILFGVGLAVRHKWFASGLLFGFAIMTRQWALLAAIPVAGFSGRDIWKFTLGGAGVCGAILLPVVISGNEEWFTAFSGGRAIGQPDTLFGKLRTDAIIGYGEPGYPLHEEFSWDYPALVVSRILPVLVAFTLGVVIFIRNLRDRIPLDRLSDWILASVITCLALRLVFEGSMYMYYWIPISVLFVVFAGRDNTVSLLSVSSFCVLAPWIFEALVPQGPITSQQPIRIVGILFLIGAVVAMAWTLTRTKSTAIDPVVTKTNTPPIIWAAVCLIGVCMVTLMLTEVISMNVSQNIRSLKPQTESVSASGGSDN